MERKNFLKGLGYVGLGSLAMPLVIACKKTVVQDETGTTTANSDCAVSPTETAGPFPTSVGNPTYQASTAYVRTDITDGQTGVPLTVKVVVKNTNDSCAIVPGAYVEIWHCNRQGYYSEFGPSNSGGAQSVDETAFNFLRGKQVADSTGTATFLSIYPGQYQGRAPHIHMQVYNAAGVSKLISQIAFIESVTNTVYATDLYGKTTQQTANKTDGIFADSLDGNIVDSLTGSVGAGYVLTKTVYVAF